MIPEISHEKLGFADAGDYVRARELLVKIGFTGKGFTETIGRWDPSGIPDKDVPAVLRRTNGGKPVETLIRLFHVGAPVPLESARAAVAPMSLECWVDAGLIHLDGEMAWGTVKVLPLGNLYLASDRSQNVARGARPDHVAGVGKATLTLAKMIMRRPVRRFLDMGTGCGVYALLASDRSERVVATDCNPRAIAFTRFNVQLNGKDNVQAVVGDLFEAVADQRFDLVVSNPPFVISPGVEYTYRDSGMAGDEFSQRLIREVPGVLEEDGYCQILCDWAHAAQEDWRLRLAGWFEGTGCDAWVMHVGTTDTSTYASTWITATEPGNPKKAMQRYNRWMDYYARLGITNVSSGFITLRKRSGGSNWFRCDSVPREMSGPVGDDTALCFELRGFLDATVDADLLETALRVAPVVRLEQLCRPGEGGWQSDRIELRRDAGLPFRATIDGNVAQLVAWCNGRTKLIELFHRLAEDAGQDVAAVTPDLVRVVRGLVANAFLLPPRIGPST